jgi:pimeloyl-ACP methyl ester carboxylesterase
MAVSKTTIVLVHGAWHSPACFDDLVTLLHGHGYETRAVQLPTAGKDLNATPIEDAVAIQETTRALAEEGKDIVLVMHSYGGFVGTASAKGLLKKDRQVEGKQGGIIHLVYLAAFLVDEGKSLGEALGGAVPDWIKLEVRDIPVS